MELFGPAWRSLLAAVENLADRDWDRPSGCSGWLVRDLVCHLVIDAQDVLITLATPVREDVTVDAHGYWQLVDPPTGDDPLDALIPRLAAAYGDPALLRFHLDDVGSAAGRAAELADPGVKVRTKSQVLTVRDYLTAYVLEATLHHLDLIAFLPAARSGGRGPAPEALAASRAALETIAGHRFPDAWSDVDALLVGTGRRSASERERADLGELAGRLPYVLG